MASSSSPPPIPLFKVFVAPPEELDDELLRVVHSGYVTQGPKVEAFEEALRAFLQSPRVVTVNSGSPPVILDAPDSPRRELDRDPDDRPQVADRGSTHRCFRAPAPQRAPAALPRRVTAADIMCSVVPAGAELRHVELFGGSTAGAPTLASCAPHTQYFPRARPTK